MRSKLKIFTPVWGDKHLDLLDRALCTSLSWSKNKPYCEDAEWLITTDSQKTLDEVTNIIGKYFNAKIHSFVYPELTQPNIDSGMILIKAVQQAVDICLRDNSPLLMATPDFFFGNGTIEAFAKIASEPGSCATIANIRATPRFLDDLVEVSNRTLVNLAFQDLHPSWKESPNNLYLGGVKVTKFEDMAAVEHFMPSPFYVNFTEEDRNHFKEWHEKKPPGFGLWDHVWPTHLLEDGRLKYIGSSDAAVMIEITDEDKNVPPLNGPNDPPNKFFRNHFHNNIQRQFVSIFRGT